MSWLSIFNPLKTNNDWYNEFWGAGTVYLNVIRPKAIQDPNFLPYVNEIDTLRQQINDVVNNPTISNYLSTGFDTTILIKIDTVVQKITDLGNKVNITPQEAALIQTPSPLTTTAQGIVTDIGHGNIATALFGQGTIQKYLLVGVGLVVLYMIIKD